MNTNPYDSSYPAVDPPTDRINRAQRDKLAEVIRHFLDDRITAFEFDEQLDAFRDTLDSAVGFVTQAVWPHYDDCDDHLVTLSKPEWDYFQRLLLLLESDYGVQTTNLRLWSLKQPVALIALMGFFWTAVHLGWGNHLLLVAIPFGIVSVGISRLGRTTDKGGPYDPILFPFGTFADLKSAYDAVGFRKARYPRHLVKRQIRSPLRDAFYHIQFYAMWLLFSPIALAFQMFPSKEIQTRVTAS